MGNRSVRFGSGLVVGVACAACVLVMGCGDDKGTTSVADTTKDKHKDMDAGEGDVGEGDAGTKPAAAQKLVILHTNDLHSHLEGFGPEQDYTPSTTGDDETEGGAARLVAAVAAARARAADDGAEVLMLDAGDFMMGTLFELLGTDVAAELSLLQTLGCDATTLGNHEFDWTPTGLAGILKAATDTGVDVPIVASNMMFSAKDPGDDSLKALVKADVIQTKLVKQVGSLQVGLFGLLGADAAQVTPQAAPVTFEAIADASARMVKELREQDGVDLVIALSHSGIHSDGQGEDRELAKVVPGIDVIVSGHTHDSLSEPVREGNTLIVTAGAYGQYLGELSLSVTPAKTAGDPPTLSVDGYSLESIDDSIKGDAMTQGIVDAYIDGIDSALADSGLAYRAVVATTEKDLAMPEYEETPVGNLVTDAYRTLGAMLEADEPPVIGVDANGQIRAPIQKGKTGEVWFADLFRVLPLGIGPDQKPGFPLVSFYLNAADIAAGLELGASDGALPNDYGLQISGLKVEYDLSKPLFGRVTKLSLVTDSDEQELDTTDTSTCYKIITTNYVAGLLGVVESFTSGLLAVNAKDADCETLVDPTTRFVDGDPETEGTQELKQWQALLGYVSALPDSDDDGVPNIPAAYTKAQGRIVIK